MKKKIYTYDGHTFTSVKALAEYSGVYEKTLQKRLARGIPIDEACENKDFRCSYHKVDDIEKSLTQICKEQSKDVELVYNRLHRGSSLNVALNKPKEITKQGKPIVVEGVLYNSIAVAVKKYNLSHKESTIRRRLSAGMKPDDVFKFDDK